MAEVEEMQLQQDLVVVLEQGFIFMRVEGILPHLIILAIVQVQEVEQQVARQDQAQTGLLQVLAVLVRAVQVQVVLVVYQEPPLSNWVKTEFNLEVVVVVKE